MRPPVRHAAAENCHSAKRPPAKANTRAWLEETRFARRRYRLRIRRPSPGPATYPPNANQKTRPFDRREWRAGYRDLRGCIASSGRGDTSWWRRPARAEWLARSLPAYLVPHHARREHYGYRKKRE